MRLPRIVQSASAVEGRYAHVPASRQARVRSILDDSVQRYRQLKKEFPALNLPVNALHITTEWRPSKRYSNLGQLWGGNGKRTDALGV